MRVYGLSKSNATDSHLRHDRRRSGPVVFFSPAAHLFGAAHVCGVPVSGEGVLGLRGAGTPDPLLVSCGSVPMLDHLGTLPPLKRTDAGLA